MNFKSFLLVLLVAVTYVNSSNAQNPYEWVGAKHNELVGVILGKLVNRPDAGTYMQTSKQLLQTTYDASEFTKYNLFPEFRSYDERINYIRANSTPEIFSKYQEIESALKTMQTVSEIVNYATQKEQTAVREVPANFVDQYLIALAVLKASARFWLPIDKGGENGFGQIKFPPSNGGGVQALHGWKILSADFAGCFFGGCAGGPVGAVAGLAGGSVAETISEW
jgi:hypothetical protein